MNRPHNGPGIAHRPAMRIFRCRKCGERITFLFTHNGRRVPCNLDNVAPKDTDYDKARHIAHAATCGTDDEEQA